MLNANDFGDWTLVKAGDKAAIDLIVGNLHVSTPDEQVVAEMRRRIEASPMVGPDEYADALVAYALIVHHDNVDLVRRFRL